MAEADRKALVDLVHPTFGRIYSGAVRSDAYLRFLVEELKPYIDGNYATLPDRDNTYVMGSSMGGLISIYAISEYPEVFGGAACLSTHWPGGDPGGVAFSQQMQSYLERNLPEPAGHRLWFDYGSEGLDASYRDHQAQVDHIVRNHEYGNDRWITYYDAGADHNEDAWRARLHYPLTFLLAPREGAPEVLARVASPDGRNEFSLLIDHAGGCASPTSRSSAGASPCSARSRRAATKPGNSRGASGAWCTTVTRNACCGSGMRRAAASICAYGLSTTVSRSVTRCPGRPVSSRCASSMS
jgi:hypothetical protein